MRKRRQIRSKNYAIIYSKVKVVVPWYVGKTMNLCLFFKILYL